MAAPGKGARHFLNHFSVTTFASFGPESLVFADIPGGNGIDLEGFDVADLVFEVESFQLEIVEPDANGNGGSTEASVTGILRFRSADIFTDGFETGDLTAWSSIGGR